MKKKLYTIVIYVDKLNYPDIKNEHWDYLMNWEYSGIYVFEKKEDAENMLKQHKKYYPLIKSKIKILNIK